jgi:hypothetical protein
MSKRYRYSITLESEPNQTYEESTRMLRAFLKMAWRSYGLKCTSAIETTPQNEPQRTKGSQGDE